MKKEKKWFEKINKTHIKIGIIILILLLTFSMRLLPIRMAHWWDETVYLQHAEIMFSDRDNFHFYCRNIFSTEKSNFRNPQPPHHRPPGQRT